MCGGSAPGQVQKTEWNNELGPRWVQTFTNAEEQIKRPYQRYPGGAESRYAQLLDNPNQLAAIENMRQFAADPSTGVKSPAGVMNAGMDQILKTSTGGYLGKASPTGEQSGGNPWAGQTDNPWVSQYKNNTAMNVQNRFQGMDSPYFRQMANQGLEDITNAYKQGTSADTTRMFNLSGAFGGSAHQNAMANNESALAKQMGNYMTGLQNSQYDRSAGLEENRLGRATQAEEGRLTRGNEGWQRAQDRGFQGYESERGRQMQSVGLGQNENQNALARIGALLSTGQVQQDYNQRNADFNYDQWSGEQNYNWNQIRNYADLLSRSMGGGAGINTSIYGGGGNGGSQAIGGLLGALALMK